MQQPVVSKKRWSVPTCTAVPSGIDDLPQSFLRKSLRCRQATHCLSFNRRRASDKVIEAGQVEADEVAVNFTVVENKRTVLIWRSPPSLDLRSNNRWACLLLSGLTCLLAAASFSSQLFFYLTCCDPQGIQCLRIGVTAWAE